jgi:hypothetical protein
LFYRVEIDRGGGEMMDEKAKDGRGSG